MQGTVKWFSIGKGYGYIIDSEGKENFVHYSSIQMDGFRYLNTDDIVDFEIGNGTTGRKQAVNVQPVLTRKMIEDSLEEENLYLRITNDSYGSEKFIVVNANNVLQTDENGMTFEQLAGFAGFHYSM